MEFSLGLVEVSALGNAIMMLDDMLKVADVEFVGVERKLGGALVTVVVRGSISAVTASVAAGRKFADSIGVLKAAEVIARPHSEILKFINLPENEKPAPKKEAEKPVKPVAEPVKKPAAEAVAVVKPEIKEEPKPVEVKAEEKKATPKKTTKTATKSKASKAEKASDIKKGPKA